jgi:hypothetical protein
MCHKERNLLLPTLYLFVKVDVTITVGWRFASENAKNGTYTSLTSFDEPSNGQL